MGISVSLVEMLEEKWLTIPIAESEYVMLWIPSHHCDECKDH